MLELAEEAQIKLFDEHDVIAEIICPTQLYPMNISAVLESVELSNRILVIEEGHGFAAWGSEVITTVSEILPMTLKCIKRVNMPDCPIPCSGELEKKMLPNVAVVMNAVEEMMTNG